MADPGRAAADGAHKTEDAAKDTAKHPARNTQIAAHEVRRDAEQHPKAVAGGAATGAGTGAIMGGPPGAIVGAILGAIRGLVAADALDVAKKHFGIGEARPAAHTPGPGAVPRRLPGERPRGVIRGPISLDDYRE